MTMTPAELRTRRQDLGLTPRYIAEIAGLHYNVAWQSEAPASKGVHPDVAAAFSELLDLFNIEVHKVELAARIAGKIERPRTPAAFAKVVPALRGWPDKSIGPFYAEVLRRTHLPIEYTKE